VSALSPINVGVDANIGPKILPRPVNIRKRGSYMISDECDVTGDSTIALAISPILISFLLQAWEIV